MMNKMNDKNKKKHWLSKPPEKRKVKYISMRVTEKDHERIMEIFGDNVGVREFLIKYAKDHQDDKSR